MNDTSRSAKDTTPVLLALLLSLIIGYIGSSIFPKYNNTISVNILSYQNGIAEIEWRVSSELPTKLMIRNDLKSRLIEKRIECYPETCNILESENITVITENAQDVRLIAKLDISRSNLTIPIYPFYRSETPRMVYINSNHLKLSVLNYNNIHLCLGEREESILLIDPSSYYISLDTQGCRNEIGFLFKPQTFQLILQAVLILVIYHIIVSINAFIALRNVPPRDVPPTLTPEEIASVKGMIIYLALREIERAAAENQKSLSEYLNSLIGPKPKDIFSMLFGDDYSRQVISSISDAQSKIYKNEYIRPEMREKCEKLSEKYFPNIMKNRGHLMSIILLVLNMGVMSSLFSSSIGDLLDLQTLFLVLGISGLVSIYLFYTSLNVGNPDVIPIAVYLGYILLILQAINVQGYPFSKNLWNMNVLYTYIYVIGYLLGLFFIFYFIDLLLSSFLFSYYNTRRFSVSLFEDNLYLEILGYAKYLANVATTINRREELDYAIVLGVPENKIQSMISHNQELKDVFNAYMIVNDQYNKYLKSTRRKRLFRRY